MRRAVEGQSLQQSHVTGQQPCLNFDFNSHEHDATSVRELNAELTAHPQRVG